MASAFGADNHTHQCCDIKGKMQAWVSDGCHEPSAAVMWVGVGTTFSCISCVDWASQKATVAKSFRMGISTVQSRPSRSATNGRGCIGPFMIWGLIPGSRWKRKGWYPKIDLKHHYMTLLFNQTYNFNTFFGVEFITKQENKLIWRCF